jgi:hypothetical protein
MTRVTMYLATEMSRRSFLARVGRVSVATAGIGMVGLRWAVPASATTHCGYDHSVNCYNLDNWNQNLCPTQGCSQSGPSWIDCNEALCTFPRHIEYHDCCSSCQSSGSGAVCKPCHCDSSGPSSCCFLRAGTGAWCDPACPDSADHVCCRRYQCASTNPTCGTLMRQ